LHATQDGSMLAIFDLAAGKEVGAFSPGPGWASEYEFAPGTVRLHYTQDGGAFAYSITGEFLDREAWVLASLNRSDLYMMKRVMEESGSRPGLPLAKQLLASIETGLRHQDRQDERFQAFRWRLKGESLESIDAPADALQSYEKALAFDAKIVVKRHVERLRKPPGTTRAAKYNVFRL
jgi:hypothetical protein